MRKRRQHGQCDRYPKPDEESGNYGPKQARRDSYYRWRCGLSELFDSLKRSISRRFFPDHSPFHDRWSQTLRENTRCPRFSSRQQMYEYLNHTLLADGATAIDFFEFGVYQGDSLGSWCALNKNPDANFFGFDSFLGLPEYWKPGRPKGTFSTYGNPPYVDDKRVQLVVGWFHQTIPEFLKSYRPTNRIVVHNDCDLYSSSLYCLTSMNSVMPPGTIIIFDEFDDILNEYRAFCDYADAYMREYRIMAATRCFTQVAVTLL